MNAELLSLLQEGALATSFATLLVLLLRRPLAHLCGAGCLPLLWALVPLAQLAVWLPAPAQEFGLGWPVLAPMAVPANPAATTAAPAASLPAATWMLLLWALGALLAAGYFLLLQRRFLRRLGRLRPLHQGILVAESADLGPAVLGILRPHIVLPADFTQRFSEEQQALIIAHERSHLRRGDVPANALATALRCVYWFNPLIHHAASRLRHDHELASDAEVVQRYPQARRRYADTLLNVQLAVPGLPVGCLWQSSHPLKERIIMLSNVHITPLRRRTGALLAGSLVLGFATLAWASQGDVGASASADVAVPEAGPSYRRLAPPKYPQAAIDARQEGTVLLKVLVAIDGSVSDIEVASATLPGSFDQAAIDTVRKWQFNPATRDGTPVAAWVQVPICFSLNEGQDPPACSGGPDALDGIYRMAPKPSANS
jgi:TonB family protein